jgi:transposase
MRIGGSSSMKQQVLQYNSLPKQVSRKDFNRYINPHLKKRYKGPKPKLSFYKIFNYILFVLHTGIQWNQLRTRRNELHWSNVYKWHHRWSQDGSYAALFSASVRHLKETDQLDVSVLHGDGSNTVVKKGGDDIGYSGHKHQKGEKELTIVENHGFVIGPICVKPVNRNDSIILPETLTELVTFTQPLDIQLVGSSLTLDSGFDSIENKSSSVS